MAIHSPSDYYLHVTQSTAGHDKLYLKESQLFAKDIDAIIPRVASDLSYTDMLIQHIAGNLGKFSAASGDALRTAANKFKTSQRLSQWRVRTPRTVLANQPRDPKFLIDQVSGLPVVAKLQQGHKGAGVFILESELSAATTLEAFKTINTDVILQQFIDTGEEKTDIRAIVVDDEVVAAYRRHSAEKDFRSNYSLSQKGEAVTLTDEQEDLALEAARAVGLKVAGVDIVEDVKKESFVIEVNGSPGLEGVETITGVNVAKKIIEFVERGVKGEKNPNAKTTNKQEEKDKKPKPSKTNGGGGGHDPMKEDPESSVATLKDFYDKKYASHSPGTRKWLVELAVDNHIKNIQETEATNHKIVPINSQQFAGNGRAIGQQSASNQNQFSRAYSNIGRKLASLWAKNSKS